MQHKFHLETLQRMAIDALDEYNRKYKQKLMIIHSTIVYDEKDKSMKLEVIGMTDPNSHKKRVQVTMIINLLQDPGRVERII